VAKSDFITYNNAGIVEAIKRNSGSTKFYKPSFQGIIEAIQDWGSTAGGDESGGGTTVLPGGSDLPDTDNTEGDLVVIPNGDGDYFMYVYANGIWERLHITTEEVEVAGSAPFTIELPDGTTLKNQFDINAYLDERITALSEKGYDDTGIKAELAQEITDRQEGDAELQSQIDALEGYDDAGIKAELAQEITDRQEGDADLQSQIDALEGYDDSALTERVTGLEAAVEELPVTIAADQVRQDDELEVHSNQINAIETQIQLLGQVKATGTWTYERNITMSLRPPSVKTFYGTDIDNAVDNVLTDWGKLRLIMISKTSIEDKTFTFSAFEAGDKVEILSTDGSSACIGTITNDPTNDSYGNFVVTVEFYKGGPVEGQEYLFSAYRPGANSGDVDLDILDGRYLIKTGDTMTGNLVLDAGSGLYSKEIIKSTREEGYALQVKPADTGDTTAFIHTNGSAKLGATSFYDVISFSGDSRIKAIDADGNEQFKVYPNGLLDTKGEIRIDRSGTAQSFVVKQDGTPKLTIRADGRAASEYAVTSSDDDQVLTTKEYVDTGLDKYLKKQGKQTTGGELKIDNGGKSYIHIQTNNTLGLYNLQEPEESHHAATRKYVDERIAASPASGGVPVGSIMIWMNSGAPDGWFKLQGASFDVDTYPLLHAYLEKTEGYTAGTLPNWSGRYPGEYGDHIQAPLGSYKNYRTARPITPFTTDNPGDHKHRYGNTDYGGGATHSADDARNHSKYQTDGAGAHTHTITGGGDSTTRPRTVIVHYIIKHD